MRSKLMCVDSQETSKDFSGAIKRLSSLDEKVLHKIPHLVLKAFSNERIADDKKLVEAEAKALDVDIHKIQHQFDITQWFFDRFNPESDYTNDSPDDIASDLVDLCYISKEEHGKISKYLAEVKSLATEQHKIRRERITRYVVDLICRDVRSAVNFRPVFEKSFDIDTKLEEHAPKCIGMIPLIQMKLTLTSSNAEEPPTSFRFTLTETGFNLLEKSLKATRLELETAKKFLDLT